MLGLLTQWGQAEGVDPLQGRKLARARCGMENPSSRLGLGAGLRSAEAVRGRSVRMGRRLTKHHDAWQDAPFQGHPRDRGLSLGLVGSKGHWQAWKVSSCGTAVAS